MIEGSQLRRRTLNALKRSAARSVQGPRVLPNLRPSDARPRGARAAAGRLEADRVRAVWDGRRRPRRAQGWIRTAKTILTGLGGKCSSYLLLEAPSFWTRASLVWTTPEANLI